MTFSDLKYLAAYIVPVLCVLGIYQLGGATYSAFIFAFVLIPVLEFFAPQSEENLTEEQKDSKLASMFFDFLLYLNVPVVFAILFYAASVISSQTLSTFEIVGLCLSLGSLLASCGINVAHELGHKPSGLAQVSSCILLLPCLYMHFFIEHNRGHHKNVATPEDPATSRYNEILYIFWIRSTVQSYISAWQLEISRLKSNNKSFFSPNNMMIWFSIITAAYIFAVFSFFSFQAFIVIMVSGVISFLFLETINYVEHYGLLREKLPSGRYERVLPKHSWNSNHHFGRIILYELTRHSDHHYLANKKYQVLDHYDNAPQLPLGYPGSMLMSLVPPLWFYVMNKELKKLELNPL